MQAIIFSIRRWLLGGTDPRSVALAVWLGVTAGMVSGWNLTFAGIVIVALTLNTNVRVFLAALGGAALLSWCLVSLTLPIGVYLLDDCGLGASLGQWGDDLFVAVFDWDRYTLVGGALLGIIAGAALAFVARRRTLALDETLILLDDELWLSQETSWRERTFARLVLGRTPPSACQPAVRQTRLLRPGGFIAAGVLTLSSLYLAWWISPNILGGKLMAKLTQINEADVSASDVRLSLGDGRVEMVNLEVADPNDPGRDRLRAARVSGRLKMGALWRGRLDVDTLRFEEVRSGIGHVRNELTSLFPPSEPLTGFRPVEANHDPVSTKLALADWLADWPTYRAQLDNLQHLIQEIKAFAERQYVTNKASHTDTGLAGLVKRRAMRSPLANAQPSVVIEHLRAEGLSPEWGLGRNAFVEMTNFSSSAVQSDTAPALDIVIPSTATELAANLNLRQPDGKHEVMFTSYEVKLEKLLDPRQGAGEIIPHAGNVMIKGDGWVDTRQLAIDLDIDIEGLKAIVAGNRPVGGLTPQLWNDALAKIDRLNVDARLEGSWESPRLELDNGQIVSELKRQLMIQGEHQLVAAVESQLAVPTGRFFADTNGQNRIAPPSIGGNSAVRRDRDVLEGNSSGRYAPPSPVRGHRDNVATADRQDLPVAAQELERSQPPFAASPVAHRPVSRNIGSVALLPGPIDMRTGYDEDFNDHLAASTTEDADKTPASDADDTIQEQIAAAASILNNHSATTPPSVIDKVIEAPGIDNPRDAVASTEHPTVSSPPTERNVPPFERTIVLRRPDDRFASTAPPVVRPAVMTPPAQHNSPAAPPKDQIATALPPVDQFAVATPPVERRAGTPPPKQRNAAPARPNEQNAINSPPIRQFAVTAPPIERPDATGPPIERNSAIAPPMEQNAVAVPPLERYTAATPPIDLNTIANRPSEQINVGTPPNDRDTIAAASSNQQNVVATRPFERNTIVRPPADRNQLAISSNRENPAATTPIQQNNIAAPPVEQNAITLQPEQQHNNQPPYIQRNAVAAVRQDQSRRPNEESPRIASLRRRLGKRLRGALDRDPKQYTTDPFQLDSNDKPAVATNRPQPPARQRNGRPVIGWGGLTDLLPGSSRLHESSDVVAPTRHTDRERVAAANRRGIDPRLSAPRGNAPAQNPQGVPLPSRTPTPASRPAQQATPPAGVGQSAPDNSWYDHLWR